MSLVDFQRALSDLVASPELCEQLLAAPESVLSGYALDDRERRRLVGTVGQRRGMSLNCTLYRMNRITPLYSMLTMSCELLGDRLVPQAEAFWRSTRTELQFAPEIEQFAAHLKRALATGELDEPFLEEALDFELALNALKFAPRRRLLAELREPGPGDAVRVSPLMRLVRFRHEPLAVLDALAREERPPDSTPAGEFYVLVDGRAAQPDFRPIDPVYGRILAAVERGEHDSPPSPELDLLVETGALTAA